MRKGSLVWTQRELPLNVPPFSALTSILALLMASQTKNFPVLIHPQPFSSAILAQALKTYCMLPAQHQKAEKQYKGPAGEHGGALSRWRDIYFPRELVESENRAKGELLLDLHSSGGHRYNFLHQIDKSINISVCLQVRVSFKGYILVVVLTACLQVDLKKICITALTAANRHEGGNENHLIYESHIKKHLYFSIIHYSYHFMLTITKTSPHTLSCIVWLAYPYPKLHTGSKSLTFKKKYIQPAYVLFFPKS